jgi:hypothetical protein
MHPILLLLLLLLLGLPAFTVADETTVSSAEVFRQVLVIEQETELMRRHFNVTRPPRPVTPVTAELRPLHVWQKTYLLLMRITAFRQSRGMDAFSPLGVAPREEMDPRYTWGQTQRVLTEIRILRRLLGVPGEVVEAPEVGPKRPLDVFNKLAEVEALWDSLLGDGYAAGALYAEALRLDEDVSELLELLRRFDDAAPPPRPEQLAPEGVLTAAYGVLGEVQRMQRLLGLPVTDLAAWRSEGADAEMALDLVVLTLAELQTVKARLGFRHAIPPAAKHRPGQRLAEAAQLLGYSARKLALIRSF